MKIKIDQGKCTECGMCMEICPVEAIVYEDVVKIDDTRCINCRMCLTVCPFKAITMR